MKNVRKGIYPGSFDPMTNGHLDMIIRAAAVCDILHIVVARNSTKESLFTIEERLEILRECCPENGTIEVTSYDGLLAEYCSKNGISFIFRGLRSSAEFDSEHAMALLNGRLSHGLETLFLSAGSEYSFLSSTAVKEIASYGGDVSTMVPPSVALRLKSKFS